MSKMAKPTKEEAVAQLLEQLPAMNHKELQQHWMELFGREPSLGMRRNHMIPILAYRAQEKAFGGLKESTVRMLRELALGNASEAQPIYRPKTGTRYVREHNGNLPAFPTMLAFSGNSPHTGWTIIAVQNGNGCT